MLRATPFGLLNKMVDEFFPNANHPLWKTVGTQSCHKMETTIHQSFHEVFRTQLHNCLNAD